MNQNRLLVRVYIIRWRPRHKHWHWKIHKHWSKISWSPIGSYYIINNCIATIKASQLQKPCMFSHYICVKIQYWCQIFIILCSKTITTKVYENFSPFVQQFAQKWLHNLHYTTLVQQKKYNYYDKKYITNVLLIDQIMQIDLRYIYLTKHALNCNIISLIKRIHLNLHLNEVVKLTFKNKYSNHRKYYEGT